MRCSTSTGQVGMASNRSVALCNHSSAPLPHTAPQYTLPRQTGSRMEGRKQRLLPTLAAAVSHLYHSLRLPGLWRPGYHPYTASKGAS